MRNAARCLMTLPAGFLLAAPASAQGFNPFVPIFENLTLLTDFTGFLFLILRSWLIFALQALPIVF